MNLVIVTTVPETLATILRGQPAFLNQYCSIVCVTSPGPMLENVKEHEGVSVLEVPMNRGISPFKDLVSIFRMWQALRRLQPDVVHSYTPKAGLVTMLAAFLAGVRVRIHTFTGLVFPTSNGFKRKVLVAIDRLICAAATKVVPEGEGVAADLRANGITSKPLIVIGNGNIAGVDTRHFRPDTCLPLQHEGSGAFTFCFVGRLNRDKGLQELVSAFTSLEGESALLLVGDLDSTAPVDKVTLDHIQSHPRIQATGFLEDIRPALKACDVLVLPSYREGFPNVVLQAGAMGKPVIASDINGCNEVVENDFNGWLVPPSDESALAERMAHVMSLSPDQRVRLGNNARARIVERYEQTAYRRKLFEFYREVASEAGL
ncbi:glycosyltransferase family 4 protein [Marinobacter flavimaris]|uniref:glycosyltransferase family 4 protein n=1 Tax=Marinobacter flavimaris TaxID=262076 RepID=UPI00386DA68E